MKYVVIFLSFCVCVLFLCLSEQNDRKEMKLLEKNYPLLETVQTKDVSGVVVSVKLFMNPNCKGCYSVKLNNADNFTLGTVARNYLYTPYDICDFLQRNDSVYKSQHIPIHSMFIEEVKNTILYWEKF